MSNYPPDIDSDEHLVARVLTGDKAAFAAIIKKTERLVAQIVCRMVTTREDQRDMVQSVYLKVYESLGRFQFHSKLSTWIGQISYNVCVDHLRKKKLLLYDDLEGDPVGKQAAGLPLTDDLRAKECARILSACIDRLPPVYRTLVCLYHQEELSYEEIAQVADLPMGTVKNYLFRARKLLKASLLTAYKKEDL